MNFITSENATLDSFTNEFASRRAEKSINKKTWNKWFQQSRDTPVEDDAFCQHYFLLRVWTALRSLVGTHDRDWDWESRNKYKKGPFL